MMILTSWFLCKTMAIRCFPNHFGHSSLAITSILTSFGFLRLRKDDSNPIGTFCRKSGVLQHLKLTKSVHYVPLLTFPKQSTVKTNSRFQQIHETFALLLVETRPVINVVANEDILRLLCLLQHARQCYFLLFFRNNSSCFRFHSLTESRSKLILKIKTISTNARNISAIFNSF